MRVPYASMHVEEEASTKARHSTFCAVQPAGALGFMNEGLTNSSLRSDVLPLLKCFRVSHAKHSLFRDCRTKLRSSFVLGGKSAFSTLFRG